jgi:mycothiol synthase
MAHINTPTISRDEQQGPQVRRPSPEEHRTALAVLLTGKPSAGDPAVDHFISFSDQHGMSLDGLWALFDGQTPIYSALIIPGMGRTAVLFTSPIIKNEGVAQAGSMIRVALASQDAQKVHLVQALLEPVQRLERKALAEAGFSYLAKLVYMRHPLAKSGPACESVEALNWEGQPLTALAWQEDRQDRFREAILASYEDTLDCPELVGVRRIEDIVEGHMAVGRFDPSWWTALYLQDEPVGVLLLNPFVDRRELELVYLGLSPKFRGGGLAGRLMNAALARAKAERFTGMLLAVDEHNAPAMRLYQGLGFRPTGRKAAMICTLK